MARIAMRMQALGVARHEETCQGCNQPFRRGEEMNAVEYTDGEPAGWFCAGCIQRWKAGDQPGQGEQTAEE